MKLNWSFSDLNGIQVNIVTFPSIDAEKPRIISFSFSMERAVVKHRIINRFSEIRLKINIINSSPVQGLRMQITDSYLQFAFANIQTDQLHLQLCRLWSNYCGSVAMMIFYCQFKSTIRSNKSQHRYKNSIYFHTSRILI